MKKHQSANIIRQEFLRFFEKNHGHKRVKSSSLLANSGGGGGGDESILFTNAGMVQFKEVFLGRDKKPFSRATSAQKCLRAGGKHNDLENVGFTPRHHTFFEMLGNFSFGDYFKEEAISMAWEFVHKEMQLPAEKLRITVFKDDDESEQLWKKITSDAPCNIPIARLGAKDNFWSMGDGQGVPCGPCTEIFYDTGNVNVPDDDRYLEIWNLVFMQFEKDSNAESGFRPLPVPCVDTGMGLERMCSVMQQVPSNYETDLFVPLIEQSSKLISPEYRNMDIVESNLCQRVISDHLRAASFLVADGVVPSNNGAGYVLRRLIRRAAGFGHRAGLREPFIHELVRPLVESFEGSGYHELKERKQVIESTIKTEETVFSIALDKGMSLLNQRIEQKKQVDGEFAFKLYDTFGFPLDITQSIAQHHGMSLDVDHFNKLMEEQRIKSGAGNAWTQDQKLQGVEGEFVGDRNAQIEMKKWAGDGFRSDFVGYKETCVESTEVLATVSVDQNTKWAIISKCPFYAQGGGQDGDIGSLKIDHDGEKVSLPVLETVSPYDGGIALRLDCSKYPGLGKGEIVSAIVNESHRDSCSIHHTSTHLLHDALRDILGTGIAQAGSLVSAEKLRFDFSYHKPLTEDQIQQIEKHVNQFATLANGSVSISEMNIEKAKEQNAIMQFDERYGDIVRVVSITGSKDGDKSSDGVKEFCSIELCGGTHVKRLRDIFPFKITAQTSVAAGVRRIEAIAGAVATDWLQDRSDTLNKVAKLLNAQTASSDHVLLSVEKLLKDEKSNRSNFDKLRKHMLSNPGLPDASNDHVEVYIVPDLTPENAKLTGRGIQEFSQAVMKRATKLNDFKLFVFLCGSKRVCLGSTNKEFVAGKTLQHCFKNKLKGKGGGSPTFAQGEFLNENDVQENYDAEGMCQLFSECLHETK